MSGFSVTIQEGISSDDNAVYFCDEAPSFEAIEVPVYRDGEEVDTTTVRFIVFTPKNGNVVNVGKECRVPMDRLVLTQS